MNPLFAVPPCLSRGDIAGLPSGRCQPPSLAGVGSLFPEGHDPGVAAFPFQVRIDFLNRQWTSSLVLGVITCPPERLNFPASACALKRAAWLLRGRGIFHNGLKVGREQGEGRGPGLSVGQGWPTG